MSAQTEVREKPILFSGPMVKAILEGRKTQTRRVMKPQPPTVESVRERSGTSYSIAAGTWCGAPHKFFTCGPVWAVRELNNDVSTWECPHGRIGSRLWVRETWADADCMYQTHTNEVPGTIAYFADKSAIQYDSKTPRQIGPIDLASWNWNALKKRPSIHMHRWASRINLEITNVRVERLADISNEDILAEGCHQRKGCAWSDNPFCWVIEFKKL